MSKVDRSKQMIKIHRRKKNLCEDCGRFSSDIDHECVENYVKSDMRGEDVAVMTKDDDKRIKTIKSYREKKDLCLFCGTDKHTEDCTPDYSATDLRTDEEKKSDPRTVRTPKDKQDTITRTLFDDEVNKQFIESTDNNFLKLEANQEVQSLRPYIILDLTRSDNGQIIGFDFLQFMARKHNSYIIFLLGDPALIYTAMEMVLFKKLVNICCITNMMDQNIANYLTSCVRFFGYPSDYATYCMMRGINSTVYMDNEPNFDLPCTIVDVKNDENITVKMASRDISCWKV